MVGLDKTLDSRLLATTNIKWIEFEFIYCLTPQLNINCVTFQFLKLILWQSRSSGTRSGNPSISHANLPPCVCRAHVVSYQHTGDSRNIFQIENIFQFITHFMSMLIWCVLYSPVTPSKINLKIVCLEIFAQLHCIRKLLNWIKLLQNMNSHVSDFIKLISLNVFHFQYCCNHSEKGTIKCCLCWNRVNRV